MANSILSSLLSKSSLSIVSSASGLDLATDLKVSRVAFKFRSRAFRHMREDGTSIVDARIILPTTCEIDVFCQTADDLSLVNALILDRTGVYRVTSKGLVMTNMMADENQIRQTPDVISATPVRIVLKKLLTQNADAPPSVAQAADSSLIDNGIQQIQSAASSVTSAISSAAASVATTAEELAQNVIANLGL